MIAELWDSFPRLLEQNIDALMDEAEPNPAKAFQLYKACQREDLWRGSFDDFSKALGVYYSKPRTQRRKSDFDAFLDRPMDRAVHETFHLNFRNATVRPGAVHGLATWAHNLIRVGYKTTSSVMSVDVLKKTLLRLTNPAPADKAEDLRFDDFCEAWKKTVFGLFGRRHDGELNGILNELRWLNTQIAETESAVTEKKFYPTIYLTQTEIDWTLAVREAAFHYLPAPKFPLSRGPRKQRLMDLERAASLYNIVQTTRLPELMKHRDRIRATILDRCDGLIREKAA